MPKGMYFTEGHVSLPTSNTNWYGAGWGNTIMIPFYLGGSGNAAFLVDSADKVSIHDMTFNFYLSGFTQEGVELYPAPTNFSFFRNEMIGVDSTSSPNVLLWIRGVNGYSVYNNIFNGMDPLGSNNAGEGVLAIEIYSPGNYNGKIYGNTFENLNVAINGYYAGENRELLVENNLFDTVQQAQTHAIKAQSILNGFTSSGNTTNTCFSNCFSITGSTSDWLQNVTSVGDRYNNFAASAAILSLGTIIPSRNVSILDTTAANGLGPAISVNYSNGVTVGGYDIFNIGGKGNSGIAATYSNDFTVLPGKVDTIEGPGAAIVDSGNIKVSGLMGNYMSLVSTGNAFANTLVEMYSVANPDVEDCVSENPGALSYPVVYFDSNDTGNVRAFGNRAMYTSTSGTVVYGSTTPASMLANSNVGYFAPVVTTNPQTVANTYVLANSRIVITQTAGPVNPAMVSTITGGTSFALTFASTPAGTETYIYEILQ
jgi:hypothetical protein